MAAVASQRPRRSPLSALTCVAPVSAAVALLSAAGCQETETPMLPEPPALVAHATVGGAALPAALPEVPDAKPMAEPPRSEEPRQRPRQAAGALPGELLVHRLVVTSAMVGREPAPPSPVTADGSPVFAFSVVSNRGAEAQRITVVFEHESGRSVGFVELEVPGDTTRWRTWAQSRHIRQPGQWSAIIRTADGRELARERFTANR